MEYLGFVASLLMGIVLGLIGGGGAILTVPILVYIFAVPPIVATSYSLFVVGTTALIGSILYLRRREIDFKIGIGFALPSVIGVNISRGFIIPRLPDVVADFGAFVLTKEVLIMSTFAFVMVLASYSMIKKRTYHQKPQLYSISRILLLGLQGLLVGLTAGFVGAGGGFLIIPALVLMAGLPMKIAVGTSLLTIAFQSLLGILGDISRGLVIDWNLLGPITVFAVGGILIGSSFAHKFKEKMLKEIFGWLVLLMGLAILLEQIRHL